MSWDGLHLDNRRVRFRRVHKDNNYPWSLEVRSYPALSEFFLSHVRILQACVLLSQGNSVARVPSRKEGMGDSRL